MNYDYVANFCYYSAVFFKEFGFALIKFVDFLGILAV
jgi:hypothetical protein